jgi:biotin carboxyl carrier protein
MKYHIKIEDHTYEVEILDLHARPIIAIVDGERFEVEPQNGQSQGLIALSSTSPAERTNLLKSQPALTPAIGASSGSDSLVRAPIPGVIVALLVRPGDQVSHGQELCTIEAMKMRNNIRASHPGQIAEVLVSVGQTVNHNDPLMRFEEQA